MLCGIYIDFMLLEWTSIVLAVGRLNLNLVLCSSVCVFNNHPYIAAYTWSGWPCVAIVYRYVINPELKSGQQPRSMGVWIPTYHTVRISTVYGDLQLIIVFQ